jgi:hypothetical protein
MPAEDMLSDSKWQTVSWRTGTKGKLTRSLNKSAKVVLGRVLIKAQIGGPLSGQNGNLMLQLEPSVF